MPCWDNLDLKLRKKVFFWCCMMLLINNGFQFFSLSCGSRGSSIKKLLMKKRTTAFEIGKVFKQVETFAQISLQEEKLILNVWNSCSKVICWKFSKTTVNYSEFFLNYWQFWKELFISTWYTSVPRPLKVVSYNETIVNFSFVLVTSDKCMTIIWLIIDFLCSKPRVGWNSRDQDFRQGMNKIHSFLLYLQRLGVSSQHRSSQPVVRALKLQIMSKTVQKWFQNFAEWWICLWLAPTLPGKAPPSMA